VDQNDIASRRAVIGARQARHQRSRGRLQCSYRRRCECGSKYTATHHGNISFVRDLKGELFTSVAHSNLSATFMLHKRDIKELPSGSIKLGFRKLNSNLFGHDAFDHNRKKRGADCTRDKPDDEAEDS
jgi:hypothetical protein